jgi:hypothetical protein
MCEYQQLKDFAEDVLRDAGLPLIQWVGPIESGPRSVVGAWFDYNGRQCVVAFASPWDVWNKREDVDKQIAYWMEKAPEEVEHYLSSWPGLCLARREAVSVCDCGGDKCHTTHSTWCSIHSKETK